MFTLALLGLHWIGSLADCMAEIITPANAGNKFMPYTLSDECSVTVQLGANETVYLQHLGAMSESDLLEVEWDDDSFPAVLSQLMTLSWDSQPDSQLYQDFIYPLQRTGSRKYLHGTERDFYRCAGPQCNFLAQADQRGPLFITITSTLTDPKAPKSDMAWIVQFRPPRDHIKLEQLQIVKRLWDTCCAGTFGLFPGCVWAPTIGATGWANVTTNDCSRLNMVSCDENGNVEALELSGVGLNCRLPSLQGLVGLKDLHLDSNQISGALPDVLWTSNNLQRAHLHHNNFSGPVTCPSSHLTELFLSGNNLSGLIPQCLGQLNSLRALDLSLNGFTGAIPHELFQAKQLHTIGLGGNFLRGNVPETIVEAMPRLRMLDLSSNELFGSLPPTMFQNASQLKLLNIDSNRLNGDFPRYDFLPEVVYLLIGNNHFTGDLVLYLHPLVGASRLLRADFSNNLFSGKIGSDVDDLLTHPHVQMLDISNNLLECQTGASWPQQVRRWIPSGRLVVGTCMMVPVVTDFHPITEISVGTVVTVHGDNFELTRHKHCVLNNQIARVQIVNITTAYCTAPDYISWLTQVQILNVGNEVPWNKSGPVAGTSFYSAGTQESTMNLGLLIALVVLAVVACALACYKVKRTFVLGRKRGYTTPTHSDEDHVQPTESVA